MFESCLLSRQAGYILMQGLLLLQIWMWQCFHLSKTFLQSDNSFTFNDSLINLFMGYFSCGCQLRCKALMNTSVPSPPFQRANEALCPTQFTECV